MEKVSPRLKVVLIIGAVWVLVSLAIFLILTGERTNVQWLGLVFLLLSETAVVAGLAVQDLAPPGTGPLFRMGSYVVLGLYLLLALPMAVVHAAGLAVSLNWLVPWELVAFALLVTLEIVFYVSSRGVSAVDAAAGAKIAAPIELLGRLDSVLKLAKLGPEQTEKLKKLCEEVRFFDRKASASSDGVLVQKAAQLERMLSSAGGDSAADAETLLDEMLSLAQVRRREAGDSQRGGF
ncbi:MAG: hypothetical protein LBO05_08420 [Deltaproteobacteria bacterium]|jgi:hypothetical protein|nr:hypothetical protein [Deltaproteobacteria bacterium]